MGGLGRRPCGCHRQLVDWPVTVEECINDEAKMATCSHYQRLDQPWARRIRDDLLHTESSYARVGVERVDARSKVARYTGRPVQALAAEPWADRVVVQAVLGDGWATAEESDRQA